MDENYMEDLARAYNEKLRGVKDPAAAEAATMAEEQLAILETLNPMRKRLLSYLRSLKNASFVRKRLLSYLRSLKNASFAALSALAGTRRIPSYRSLQPQGGFNRLIDLEIELFIALDTLRADSNDGEYDRLVALETRFSALLGNLR